ncbi:MAG: PPC domain-containing DNA-binding protein [Planctomycetota bacterium]
MSLGRRVLIPTLTALALSLGCAAQPREPLAQDPPQEAPAKPAKTGPVASKRTRAIALRLRPGQDLLRELQAAVERERLEAAAVVTCVGSLTKVTLRYANQPKGTLIEGHHLEIVSLVGTLSTHGTHLHLSVSDERGNTLGGHLLEGSSVYTTAEIVLLACDDLRFVRELDPVSTYEELAIEPVSPEAR